MAAHEDPLRVGGLIPGREGMSSVVGDLDEAKRIVERCLDVIKQFCDAVVGGDVGRAYALCADEVRARRNEKQFAADLRKQDETWGGAPIDHWPERVVWVYASEASRKRSNKDHDWPKDTPKPAKRAMINVWWTTEKPEGEREIGRPLTFWVAEEAGGYRVAKFEPFCP